MQPVIMKAVGGLMASMIMLFNVNVVGGQLNQANIQSKIEQRQKQIQEKQEYMNQEIEEIIDTFNDYADDYSEVWIDNNIDWIINENGGHISPEDLGEMKDEALERFVFDYENLNELNIDEDTYKYMEKQLPKNVQDFLQKKHERGNRLDGNTIEQNITWYYIKYKILNEDLSWLGGKK